MAKNDSGKMTFEQSAASGGAIPNSYKGRKKAWANQVKKYSAGGGVSPAAQIDGEEFVAAAKAYGLGTDNDTLNKIVARVNKGESVREAAKAVAQSRVSGESKMQAGGVAKLAKMLKGTQEALPATQREAIKAAVSKAEPTAAAKKIEAPTIIIPSKVSEVKEAVRQSKGDYGARRVERAADEIRNLERLYQKEALRGAFTGDNAKALMTIKPQDFEKFAEPLERFSDFRWNYSKSLPDMTKQEYLDYLMKIEGGFSDVPYLEFNKARAGEPGTVWVSGHEGRHRNRAMANRGEPAGLVQLFPRAELREPLPRRSQEEYIEALRKELGQKVRPQQNLTGEGPRDRPLIDMPDIYANGGEVKMADNRASSASMSKTGAIEKLKAMAKERVDAKALKEFVAAGNDVPATYKGREHIWNRKVQKFAEGGNVEKPYIGYRRAGRRPESQQNREASANIPVAVARGLVSGSLGMPGDIESLVRLPYELITGRESKTILPTSEDIEKRLPFRGASQTPVGQMFTGASQLAGGAYTGPLSGARAVMAVPKAAMQAGRDFVGAAGKTVSPLTVYHGSPHKFEKFDASKIGTGEGAQAYGHGLYFAEAPGVASDYKRKLSNTLNVSGNATDLERRAAQMALTFGDNTSGGAIKWLSKYEGKGAEHTSPALTPELIQSVKQKFSEGTFSPGGHLYTVDLPDEKIARMLDWDKPLSEQSEVIKALKGTDYEVGMSQKQAEKIADQRLRQEAYDWADETGGDPVDFINNANWDRYVDQVRKESGSVDSSITGADLHKMIMRDEGYRPGLFDTDNYQIGTSEALRGYGIPGVKYLDATSRQAKEGTRNFVVFPGEEDALTILERKKEGGEVGMKDGGAAFGRYTTGKKYQAAKKRAEEADVNTLPDPRTYAFVSGLLGTAPDQLGFSVMHPDYKGIQKVGEKGFMGGTILGVAPVVAPLTKGLPVGATIKPKGGNWLTGSVERSVGPLRTGRPTHRDEALMLGGRWGQDVDTPEAIKAMAENAAINNWIDRNLTNYIKKEMATPEDPVRRLAEQGVIHIPSEQVGMNRHRAPKHRETYGGEQLGRSEAARAWEDASDVAINAPKAKAIKENESLYQKNPWIEKLSNEDRVYALNSPGFRDPEVSGLGFDHIVDVLKQDLAAGRIRPDQLNKVSMEQAVRRTYEYDQEMARKMREAAIKNQEGFPTYKEYPEGYRWIELKVPDRPLPEGYTLGGGNDKFVFDPSGKDVPNPNYKALEEALKYEGDTMGHCVGGYCPDVLEGRKRIYSLRDVKGEPHVTVEVQPNRYAPRHEVVMQYMAAAEKEAKALPNGYTDKDVSDIAVRMAKENAPQSIVQIKGKSNRAPNEEYLPFVQDFVRSGKWSDVGDFKNTGLYRKSDFIDEFKPEQLDAVGQGEYLTMDEIRKLREGKSWKPIDTDPELDINIDGMKKGGAVKSDCGCETKAEGAEVKMQAGGASTILKKLLSSGAKPEKVEKLTRAPVKSKEEIESIAQRVAPQVTGEFVRGSKGTASVAEKTQKQFAREKNLPVSLKDDRKMPQKRIVDPQELKGTVVTGIQGDPTITGKSLESVGDIKLGYPSPQHGGPLYGLGRNDNVFWASGLGPASGVQRVAKEASQTYDAPVLGQYIMMGPESINYAQHFADANLQAIDLSKMSKRQIEQFNKLVRFGDEKSGPRPSFPGIEDKESAYLHLSMDPHLRRHFNRLMQMPTITDRFNLPSGQDVRFAVTEPELRNLETGVTGFSMGRLAPNVSKSDLPLSSHPTYSHDIPGEFIGGLKYPTPYELTFPDTLMSVRANPKQVGQEFGSLKMVGPRQIYDQQMIDELKMYEEAMKKYTGKKKGGAVKSGLSALAKA